VAPPPVGWPQMLHDANHSSVSPDQKLSATTASTMGVNWMSAMRSADVGSPVAAYNSALGKTEAVIGDERGDTIAFDESNGTTLWSVSMGVDESERSSPMVAPDGSIWTATVRNTVLFKLDGADGTVLCSAKLPQRPDSSMMFATPPGGVLTVYTGVNHTSTANGPEIAVNESNCKQEWSYDKYLTLSGVWATPAFGVDVNGKGRVFVGTADPDSTMYAVDALTGAPIWNFSALNPPDGEFDVGAAATFSAPGNNGFADGVLYFPSKYGVMYALNGTTGKKIWAYNFNQAAGVTEGGRSAASLYKNSLVYGMGDGVESVDAKTGKLLWHYIDPSKQEVLSSPAIVGPSGEEIVAFGDVSGLFTVLRLSDGKVLYKYQTGNYITASPAIINGHILIASTDGFLYDFTANGYNVAPPKTLITAPATGSKVANPGGPITISGTAADPVGVTEIQLAIQMGGPTGPFYNGASGTWVTGAYNNFVSVDHSRQKQSTWSFALPVPPSGSTYQVTANAVDLLGSVDRVGTQSSFVVSPGAKQPHLILSTAIAAPGTGFTAYGSPFAPNEKVDFALQGVTLAKGLANANGFVPKVTIAVPSSDIFGQSALTATGETSKKVTTAAIDISNIWTQVGYGPTHSGYEPNDSVLSDTIQSTHNGYISPSWMFQTGAAVNASPAIVGGSAYVANDAGAISAVDTASCNPCWTYQISSGAAIHGSPAVGNGDVVFGADDGSIYRLANTTGALIGSEALGGVPTDVALTTGIIYVGTDSGSVFAINEASGAQVWQASVGSAIHQAPTVDVASGYVIVGDDAGNVTTLNIATGAQVRQSKTSASVSVAPEIVGGNVLVAGSDGNVRAFNEKSGTLVWTYTATSPVHALASNGQGVYVGDDGGQLAKLSQTTGKPIFVGSGFAGNLVGISHAGEVSVDETSKGHVNALKDSEGGRIQYDFVTKANLSTQPAIVDGTVFVGAEDGGLYTFTNHGQAPQAAIEHQLLLQIRKNTPVPANWASKPVAHLASLPARAFEPHGQRDFAMHLDRPGSPRVGQSATVASGSAAKTYVLGWSPVPVRAAAYVSRVSAVTGTVAGSTADTTPYPRILDDAAVQHEIARAVAANHWLVNAATRFVVVTAGAPVSASRYCDYHSAFHLGGNLTAPVIYGVVPALTTDGCPAFGAEVGIAWNELQLDPFARNR